MVHCNMIFQRSTIKVGFLDEMFFAKSVSYILYELGPI